MNVLVAGGAGYIGSHTVKSLLRAGHQPVIFDNRSDLAGLSESDLRSAADLAT